MVTEGHTDKRTGTPFYRDAAAHLKRTRKSKIHFSRFFFFISFGRCRAGPGESFLTENLKSVFVLLSLFLWFYRRLAIRMQAAPLWFRTARNRDVSEGLFAHPLNHSVAPYRSRHSVTLLAPRSLVRWLAPELTGQSTVQWGEGL